MTAEHRAALQWAIKHARMVATTALYAKMQARQRGIADAQEAKFREMTDHANALQSLLDGALTEPEGQ